MLHLSAEIGRTSNGIIHREQEIQDVVIKRTVPQKSSSLLKALHICFGLQFYSIGILKFIADCAGFMGPLLLNKLVRFIETKSESIQDGYLYAAGLLAVTFVCKYLYKILSLAKEGTKSFIYIYIYASQLQKSS